MTVERIENEMSASELLEWIEYYRDDPGHMCPMFGGGSGRREQTPEEQEAILQMMAER